MTVQSIIVGVGYSVCIAGGLAITGGLLWVCGWVFWQAAISLRGRLLEGLNELLSSKAFRATWPGYMNDLQRRLDAGDFPENDTMHDGHYSRDAVVKALAKWNR